MKTRTRGWGAISVLCLSLLSACGGGGGGGDAPAPAPAAPTNPNPNPVASTSSFALAAGYQARLIAGSNDNFDISGGCTGTANITINPLTPASFEGISGFAAPQVSTATLTNCSPASSSSSGTTYYNTSYSPLGFHVTAGGSEYAVFAAPPLNLPASVKVGDTGTIVTYNTYSNSSKATLTGTRTLSYEIEPDTTTTAIFNLITKSFNTSNAPLSTQKSRYKMAVDGTLTLLTIEVQFETTSVLRLVYTKR